MQCWSDAAEAGMTTLTHAELSDILYARKRSSETEKDVRSYENDGD